MTRLLVSDARGPVVEITLAGGVPFVWWSRAPDRSLDPALAVEPRAQVAAIVAWATGRGWRVDRREEAVAA
jgi:hypothetical protein